MRVFGMILLFLLMAPEGAFARNDREAVERRTEWRRYVPTETPPLPLTCDTLVLRLSESEALTCTDP